MYDVWQAPDVITAFGTLLAGSAACVGAFVAMAGLNTWKKQVIFQKDQDLVQRALVALSRFERAIQDARNGALQGKERRILRGQFWHEYSISDDERQMKMDHQFDLFIFDKFWPAVEEAKKDLEAVAIEADALWDEGVSNQLVNLRYIYFDLKKAKELELALSDPEPIGYFIQNGLSEEQQEMLYSDPFGDDSFSKSISQEFVRVASLLRSKLDGRRQW